MQTKCWGKNDLSQIGSGAPASQDQLSPVTIGALPFSYGIAAGGNHTCASNMVGLNWCWGFGVFGQLGDGLGATSAPPVRASNLVAMLRGRASATSTALAVGSRVLSADYSGNPGYLDPSSGSATHTVTGFSTTTSLSITPNPSTYGGLVSFTAQVTSGSGTPTGTVTIYQGSTPIAVDAPLDGAGSATITATPDAGPQNYHAEYAGDGGFEASVSSTVTHTVDKAPTTTALATSPNPSAFGQLVTLTATVSSGAGTPGGSVSFFSGSTSLGSATLGAGQASIQTAALTLGVQSLTAVYTGDINYEASTSSSASHEVTVAETSVALSSSPNPSAAGQPVTLTATVSSGAGTPGGTVTFKNGATTLGTGTLASGVASLTISNLPVGSLSLTAAYGAAGNFGGATSAPLTQVVNAAPTVARLLSSPNPSAFGQSVTLKAEVDALGGGAPTGSVSFGHGTTALGTATLEALGARQETLAAGGPHTCALTAAGGVQCWGSNYSGQIGDGTTTDRPTPTPVAGLSSGVIAVATGSTHSCALTNVGGVWCWGENRFGQLGDGTVTNRAAPVLVTGLSSGITDIVTSDYLTCALTSGGVARCWGENTFGQVGDGTTTQRQAPVTVSGLPQGVVAIGTGRAHACAMTSAGAVWCWGWNQSGQIGDGTNTTRRSPVPVTGLPSGVVGIGVGEHHTCALTGAGGVWCWGNNDYGQLGDSTTVDRTTPVQVNGLPSDVAVLRAGGRHNCALTQGGSLYCWGSNEYRQLANAGPMFQGTPVAVTGLPGEIVSIIAGTFHTCASTNSGAVWCWGYNTTGAIGDGTTIDRVTPVLVPGFSGLMRAKATLATTSLPAGALTLSATYAGDASHSSSAATTSHTVEQLATTTTLAASPNPATFGQSVTLTAAVAAASGTPTGTVDFYQGATLFASGVALDGAGAASITWSAGVGSQDWSAVYAGAGGYAGSTSSAVSLVVDKAPTTTTLSSSPNPSAFGQSATLTASVTSGGGAPTGSVEFFDGTTSLGTATLNGAGEATLATAALPFGPRTLGASYLGDASFLGSDSAGASHEVSAATTTLTLSSSANPSVFGQSVTLTTTAAADAGTPDGEVTFRNGATTLGTATLAGGTATLALSSLPVGTVSLTAVYGANGGFAGATSAPLSQIVDQASATVTLAAAATQRKPGETATLTATVAPVAPSTAIPTGTVSFRQGDTEIGSAPVDGAGVATFTTAALPLGAYKYTAVYSGSASFAGATSSVVEVKADYRLGSEAKVNVNRAGPQTRPAVARGASGEALAVWESATAIGQPISIRGRRITAAGALAPGEIVVAAPVPGSGAPKVAGLSNGDYVVVWHVNGASGREIRMRLYAPDGTPRGSAVQVNTVTAGEQAFPVVTGLVGGGFVVAWQTADEDGSGNGVVAQLYANSGAKVGGPFAVNTTTDGDQSSPVVTALTSGGFAIGWTGPAPGGFSAFVQRFTATGVRVGGETPVSPTAMTATPVLALGMRASNAFQAAWSEPTATLPTDIFSASGGAAAGAVFRVNRATAGAQDQPAVTMIEGGKFVISWTSPDRDLEGVAAHVFSAASGRIEREFPVNTNESGRQRAPALAPLGAGADAGKTYIALWSWLARDGDEDIAFQRFAAP